MSRTILVVGGAGYVGEMLCHQLSLRSDVAKIISLDKEPQSDFSKSLDKVLYVQHNMADEGWEDVVAASQPDTIIHTAWQIRTLYGQAKEQWRLNIDGSGRVFDFAFTQPSVQRLIFFSTSASYSARADNRFEHLFTEDEPFRDDDYLYAKEKKAAEELLYSRYQSARSAGVEVPQITVLRPAAITGPRGRFMRIRFGLQSALQGNLSGGFLNRLIRLLTTFMPAPPGWVRQFVHEDDVNDVVMKCAFESVDWRYEVFNLVPVSDPVYPKDMAAAVGKRVVRVYPWMVRLAFWLFWHGTRGRVPTSAGVWRVYSYPLLMSGEKLATVYRCLYSSKEAFAYTDGRYEEWVPEEKRRTKNKS